MGFGRGPFGRTLFGRSSWARAVLFDSLPTIYREYDSENDNVLETLVNAIEPTFENARLRIENWTDLRDPLKVRSTSNTAQSIRLGLVKQPDSRIEQRGADGFVTSQRRFQSNSARFRAEDQGKTLTVLGSGVLANNQIFKIASVISSSSVTCDPPLIVDAGPFKWEMRAFPDIPEGQIALEVRGGDVLNITPGWQLFDGQTRFTITHRQQFFPMAGETRLLTEREGVTGQVLLDGTFQAETPFTQKDVGKPLTISGSAVTENNGKFQIREVEAANPNSVKLWEPFTVIGSNVNGGVTYTLRPGSGVVRILHEADGALSALAIGVLGGDITVSLATNATGAIISTATQVVAALSANTLVAALVSAQVTGTGAGAVGTTDFVTLPGACLTPDAGPLFWALLPFPEIRIVGEVPPAGIVQRENVDLTLNGNQVSTLTGKFTPADVGNLLVVGGSALGSNGVYPITAVTSASVCTVAASFPLESGLAWSVRSPSLQPNALDVQVAAPSLLENLAGDFALTIDERESESRQRSWIENSVQWMDEKGTDKAYRLIGAISGFNATSTGLFRIPRGTIDAIPAQNRVIIGETAVGRVGLDGYIYSVGSKFYFSAPSANFAKKDVGLSFYLRNTNSSSNEGFFEIAAFVDSHNVQLSTHGTLNVGPDYGLGGTQASPGIFWRLCRMYSSRGPALPRYDDLNVELMQSIVGPDHFRMDSYLWDPAFFNSFLIAITNVTPPEVPGVPIYYTVELTGMQQTGSGTYSTARVINNPAVWQLTDSSGQVFSIETLPIQTSSGSPEVFTLEVFAGEIPLAGIATLTYLGDNTTTCDFCRSNVAVVQLAPGDTLIANPAELSTALDIVNTRLMDEVRPAHVTLVPAYDNGATAVGSSLNPNYMLLEYALASNLTDSVEAVDQLYVIKNDINIVDAGSDQLGIADLLAVNFYGYYKPSISDSIVLSDTTATEITGWTPSLPTTLWLRDFSPGMIGGSGAEQWLDNAGGAGSTSGGNYVNVVNTASGGGGTYLLPFPNSPFAYLANNGDGVTGSLVYSQDSSTDTRYTPVPQLVSMVGTATHGDYLGNVTYETVSYSGWALFRTPESGAVTTDGGSSPAYEQVSFYRNWTYTGDGGGSPTQYNTWQLYVTSTSVRLSHNGTGATLSGLTPGSWNLYQFSYTCTPTGSSGGINNGTLRYRVNSQTWATATLPEMRFDGGTFSAEDHGMTANISGVVVVSGTPGYYIPSALGIGELAFSTSIISDYSFDHLRAYIGNRYGISL